MVWLRYLMLMALCIALSFSVQAKRGRPVTTTSTISLLFGGVTRTAEIYTPTACVGAKKCPLMMVFHSNGSTGFGIEKITGFDTVADSGGFVVAYPESLGSAWILTGANSDPMFAAALVTNLANTGLIDATQAYVAGYSQGGGMATQTVACNPGLIKGIGIVADDLYPGSFNYCGYPTRPLPVVEFHGTADPVSPYNGGPNGTTGGNTLSAQASAQEWATIDGLTRPPQVSGDVQIWANGSGTTVTFYTVPGGGHTWPGGNQPANGPLGVTPPSPNASAVMAQILMGR